MCYTVLTSLPPGTVAMSLATVTPTPKKRGPKTPEGKARSKMNAVKHGLRARSFSLLPEESAAEWAEHMADLRRCYGPVDAAEEKLVAAIAVAMWNEIRADRTLSETMAAIPPAGPGCSHGADMQEPAHGRAMGTAIRYMTAASMASQRAQRAFIAHRKAKRAGLILAAEEPVAQAAAQDCTNGLSSGNPSLGGPDLAAGDRTNDFEPRQNRSAERPDQPAVQASGRDAPLPAPLPNRHQRRRDETLARQSQRRAA
jgi:hypothetical protein